MIGAIRPSARCNLCPRPTRNTTTDRAVPARVRAAQRSPRPTRSKPTQSAFIAVATTALTRDVGMLVPPQREALQDGAEDLPRHVHRLGVGRPRDPLGARARAPGRAAPSRGCAPAPRGGGPGPRGRRWCRRRAAAPRRGGSPGSETTRRRRAACAAPAGRRRPGARARPRAARRSGARAGAGGGPAWRRSGRRRRAPRHPSAAAISSIEAPR